MWDLIVETLIEYWPALVSGISLILGGLLTYIVARLKYKTKVAEKETTIAELQKAIIDGSYILCPSCGEKIYLKDAKVYTGGKKTDEK